MLTRHRSIAAAAVVLALGAAGCSSSSDDPGTTQSGTPTNERVTLRIPASTQSGGYPTPYAAIRGPGRLTGIFDTLAFPDVTGEPKPWLAKSWTTSPDGKTWTFTLNDNVKFHDGMPLTFDDVVFTFDYNLKGAGVPSGVAAGVTYIDTVTAPDPKTVVIALRTVRPSFLHIAGTFGFAIMPSHVATR